MKKIEFVAMKRFQSVLESLKDRTQLSLSSERESWKIEGRNSPFISHKSVSLGKGHGISGLLVLGDNELFIASFEPETIGPALKGQIPSRFLWRIARDSVERTCLPSWLKEDRNVFFVMPDTFIGFDEDGRPQFQKSVEIKVSGRKFSYQDPVVWISPQDNS